MNKDSSWIRICDRILLVDCPEKKNKSAEWNLETDLDRQKYKKIINSQSSIRDKLSFADDVLFNYGEREYLKKRDSALTPNPI